jgi:long-chain acyl-CoA synthetase
LKDEEKTREAIDEEGWLHTGKEHHIDVQLIHRLTFTIGDVAELDVTGRLILIDRIKNLLKLSQGEYVALEKVENAYQLLPLWVTKILASQFSSRFEYRVAQIFVHGDGLQSYVIAIVVPSMEIFPQFASNVMGKKVSIEDPSSLEEAIKDERVIQAFQKELDRQAKESNLAGWG